MNNNYYGEGGRPFYYRLPTDTPETYQGNDVVNWLTKYWDSKFLNTVQKLDDLPRQFNPEICDAEYLDFLAILCGFTPPFWNKDWSVSSKRVILKNSYSRIWSNKGSLDCVSFILTALNIEHKIYQPGSFIIGEGQLTLTPLGQGGWQFTVILPVKYSIGGKEFRQVQKIVELFAPCWCKSEIIQDTATDEDVLLEVDSNTLLDLNNGFDLLFLNSPGNFSTTGGTFLNPIFNEEEVNLLLN